MLYSYVKLALKVLLRRKFFTAISLFGIAFTLTVALAGTALLDHLVAPLPPEVRLERTLHAGGFFIEVARDRSVRSSTGGAGYALLDRYARDLPHVERVSIHSGSTQAVSFVRGVKVESSIIYADGPYWEILDFEFLEGGPFTQQDEENGARVAVISEATRERFFEGEPAVGRTLELDGRDFRVLGVVRNVDPARESACAEIWAPHSSRRSQEFREDYFGSFEALLLVGSPSDFADVKAEFRSRMEHLEVPAGYDRIEVRGEPGTRFERLAGETAARDSRLVSPATVMLWGFAGSLLAWMLLPTLNLVNINMSRIIERSSEIGVRKAFGASSRHLVGQFVLENVILCIVGSLLAIPCALLLREWVAASGIVPHLEVGFHFRTFLYALGLACLFGVLSGAIPAWRMSRLHPVQALRGGGR